MISLGFFSKLSKKEKIGLVVAGIIVLAVLVDRAVIAPMGAKLRRVEQEIAFREKKLNHDLRNIHNKDFIEREYKRYKEFLKKNSASDEENVSNMLAEIEGVARTTGVDLVDVKPQASKQVDFYKEYAAEVTIEGRMDQVVAFLHKLNSSSQLLRAVKVHLGMAQKGTSAVKASLLVTHISM
jgi:Tfp pilus assembly protein PilO